MMKRLKGKVAVVTGRHERHRPRNCEAPGSGGRAGVRHGPARSGALRSHRANWTWGDWRAGNPAGGGNQSVGGLDVRYLHLAQSRR